MLTYIRAVKCTEYTKCTIIVKFSMHNNLADILISLDVNGWLNALDSQNILLMLVTLLTSHDANSWLNALASLNTLLMLVTLLTSHDANG